MCIFNQKDVYVPCFPPRILRKIIGKYTFYHDMSFSFKEFCHKINILASASKLPRIKYHPPKRLLTSQTFRN